MGEWHQDWLLRLHTLLESKGGYEIIRTLLLAENNERIESEIASETGGPMSTVEQWLQKAESEGLVEGNPTDKDNQMVRSWRLKTDKVPDEMVPLIKERGEKWRDDGDMHANTSGYSHWQTGPNLVSVLMSLDPDANGYVELSEDYFKP